MAGKISPKGQAEENKVEAQALAESIIDLIDDFFKDDSESMAEDYADDVPRNQAVKGIDDLRRGLFGPINERQDAQLVYILHKINGSETLDHHNDGLRQQQRKAASAIKRKAYRLLHLVRRAKP